MSLEFSEDSSSAVSLEGTGSDNVQRDDVYTPIPDGHSARISARGQGQTCKHYFYGQLANGTKSAVWWSMIGFISSQLIDSPIAITATRCVFNIALMFCSLFNGLVAELVPMQSLLCSMAIFRILIWVCFIPLSWYFFVHCLHLVHVFLVVYMLLTALDAIAVGLSNTCDLVYEGVDRISHQYDLVIPRGLHSQMNNTYQMIFDLSFAVLIVPIGLVMYSLGEVFKGYDLVVFAALGGGLFLVLSCISLVFYARGMNRQLSPAYLSDIQGLELTRNTMVAEMWNKLRDIKDGMKITYLQGGLFKHIFFLAVETAFEDTMTSLVIPVIAQTNGWFKDPNPLFVNLVSICFIALGKFGGCMNGLYMSHICSERDYTRLHESGALVQQCLSMSAIAMLLLPLSVIFTKTFPNMNWLSIFIMASGIFLFYAFTAFPKIVASSAVQAKITQHPLSYKLFDFVAAFTTLIDIVVLLLLTLLCLHSNATLTVEAIVFHTAGAYIVHALVLLCAGI